jgi:tetratricopeptide (TPR) repeat protein
MKRVLHTLFFVLITCCCITEVAQAQINMPAASPSATLTQQVGLGEVKISYSRPSMKGRKIFGSLIQYGELWRTGANAATTFTFNEEVSLEGKKIPAGTYSLFSIPGQTEWTVILNKNTRASTADYKQADDVARFTVKSAKTASTYETFTIDISDITTNTALINIKWENTKVSLKLETEVDSKVMAQIKDRMEPNANVYYQAAVYYMESGKDLKQAMEWMNKATAKDPQFWQLHQKAKLQAKLNDNKGAIETAKKSIELAKVAQNNDYVRLNESLIAELQKAK